MLIVFGNAVLFIRLKLDTNEYDLNYYIFNQENSFDWSLIMPEITNNKSLELHLEAL